MKKPKSTAEDEYLKSLMEAEIPKTILEKFDKTGFELSPKEKLKLETESVESDETPSEKTESEIEEKPKSVAPKPKPEEAPKAEEPVQIIKKKQLKKKPSEEKVDTSEEKVETLKEPVIEQPKEIVEKEEVIEEVKQKKTIKKKKPVVEELKPVEPEPEKPDESEVETEEISEPVADEKTPKPKKKKVVKKPKTDDSLDYIQKLIDAEIEKTELEQYEKPEFEMAAKAKKEQSSELVSEASPEKELAPSVEEPGKKLDEKPVEQPTEKPVDKKKTKPKAPTKVKSEDKPEMQTENVPKEEPQLEEPRTEDQPKEVQPEKIAKKKPKEKEPIPDDVTEKPKEHVMLPTDEVVDEKELPKEPEVVEEVKKKRKPKKKEESPKPEEEEEDVSIADSAADTESISIAEPSVDEEISIGGEKVVKPKKKKIIKKPKVSAEDEYLLKLMEAEIPKTALEKYEKVEIETEKKPKEKPQDVELVPQKPKVLDKPKKPVPEPVAEKLESKIKITKKKRVIEPEAPEEKMPSFKLKSRINYVEYPPDALPLRVTDINAVRQQGDLSRNIEEAEKMLQKKPKKFKHIKKRKDSLERPELEKYERYESSSDESVPSKSYQRPEKQLKPELIEHKTLKLGKGQLKPQEEDLPETIKLKKIPQKAVLTGEPTEAVKKPKEKPDEKPITERTQPEQQVGSLPDLEFKPFDYEREELEIPEEIPAVEPKDKEKKPKPTKVKKPKPEPETVEHPIVPGTPKPKEEEPEEDIKRRIVQKPKPDEEQDTIKLRPIPKAEDATDKPEKDVDAPLELPRRKSKSPDEPADDVTIKKKRPKKPKAVEEPETIDEVTLKPVRTEDEEITGRVQIGKKKPTESAEAEISLKLQPSVDEEEAPEDMSTEVEIKLAKKPEEPATAETAIKLKKKKSKKPISEEEASLDIKKTEEVEEIEESAVTLKKPSKKTKPIVQEELEEEFVIKPKKESVSEEISESIQLKKKRKPRPVVEEAAEETVIRVALPVEPDDDESQEISFTVPKSGSIDEPSEDIEAEGSFRLPADNEDVTEEFTIHKKSKPKPKPVVEEHNEEFTIKKLKPKKKPVTIPGYTDVENVTFRPRSTKTKEDVEQEFKIQLDSYAEEEVSMSGKIKLKKTKPLTYSEETGEANIQITQEYDDGEGPIVEEIDDDFSEPEDTMYDVDEPDEFSEIEELPENIQVKLKPKREKPKYKVEEIEGEDLSIGFIKKRESVTYDEDSLTLKKPKKKPPTTYLEGYYFIIFFFFFIYFI